MSGTSTKKQSSRVAQISGVVLAATGLAHYVKPEAFESITKSAFPRNTRQHTYVNGGLETALGLTLISPKTRKLALIGGIGYVVYLGSNAARNAG
ncbi:MAG: hypothetical protein ABWY93_16835 [Mycobacterium sp.]